MGYSNDRLELLVARFYGYKLFHVVLSAEPTDEVMEAVLGDDTLEAAEVLAENGYDVSLLVEAVKGLRQRMADDSDFVADAHKAYNKLFLVPGEGSVKLYESVYADQMNTIFGQTTVDMRRYLREAGLASDATGNFPEDYLPLMLDFMGALAQRAWEAASESAVDDAFAAAADGRAAGVAADGAAAVSAEDVEDADQEQVQRLLATQRAFADEHLGAWLGSVVASLDARDESRVYFALGEAMEQFVASDKQWLAKAVRAE